MALAAPRPVVLIDPVDARLKPLETARCRELCEWPAGAYQTLCARERFVVERTAEGAASEQFERAAAALKRIFE